MRRKIQYIASLLSMLSIAMSCRTTKDLYTTPTYTEEGFVNAIVEIPAGTNLKIEYNLKTKKFTPDQRDGRDRVIEFLPYPANYGFIPNTLSDKNGGGDGDALDILILGSAFETGSILEVIPIGMLNLIDDGEVDYKIIAIPADKTLQTVSATSLKDLQESYPKLIDILVMWFLNYDPGDETQMNGVSDEKEALEEIKRNLKT